MSYRYIVEELSNHQFYGPFDSYGDAYAWSSGRSGYAIVSLIEVPSTVDLRNRLDAEVDDQFAVMS
ncbi:MAG: hypothetical protein U1E81_10365 [Xanthobacteraceae bacterium]|jgi:hypothetical protein|nr:hypothetical protein [Bradyrhizobiaceae bacterium]